MSWTGWLLLAVSLFSLYALGLVVYRILLATKKLSSEVKRAEAMIDELENTKLEAITPSRPAFGDQFEDLLVNRELLKRARAKKAEERKHRLIERISSIEVDKR